MAEKKKNKKTKIKNEKKMSFVDHLEEMRWVIVKSLISVVAFSIISFIFSKRLVEFLTAPYPGTLIALGPTDIFFLHISLSITVGIIASLPVIIYQFWSFIAPGLLEKEKGFVPWILFFTILCFIIGASFAYYMIIPLGLKFFAKWQTSQLLMNVSIDKYVSFMTRILIAFGAAFELPIMSMFLARIGLLTPDFMRKMRGYAVVVLFAGAAVLTPPDGTTQIALAIPMVILYEISIWLTKIVVKKREEELEETLKDEDEYEVIEKEKPHKKLVYGLLTVVGIIIIIPASVIIFKIQLPYLKITIDDVLPISSKAAYSTVGLMVILYLFAVYKVVRSQRKKTVIRKKKSSKKIRKASTTPEKVKKEQEKGKKPAEKEKDVEEKKEPIKALEPKKEEKIEEEYEDQYDDYEYEGYEYKPEKYTKTTV
ncbi:twin-arginine translocase subunit TatC, partial [candidate division KSB1 bacterium]